jgi:hypothetical protein
MLPPRSNGWLLRARLAHYLGQWPSEVCSERSGDSEVVKPTVCMSKRKHKLWCGHFAGQADHNAVDRPLTLHFHPVSAAHGDIRAIRPLRDHPSTLGRVSHACASSTSSV